MYGSLVQFFIQRGEEYRLPETFDSSRRLFVTDEPVREVFFGVIRNAGNKCIEPTRYGNLVSKRKGVSFEESRAGVQRRGQRGRAQCASAASGFDHSDFIKPAQLILRADTTVQFNEIGAAAKEQVLAVVDDFACSRMLVRRGASANVRLALDQTYFVPGIGECLRCGEPSDTSTDDSNGFNRTTCFRHRLASASQAVEKCAKQPARENSQLPNSWNRNPLGKYIEISAFNTTQQAVVNRNQHPQRRTRISGNERQQCFARFVVVLSAIRLKLQKLPLVQREMATTLECLQFFDRYAKAFQIFKWQIDPVALRIFTHIAENVGELKGNACFFSQSLCSCIAVLKDTDTDQAYNRSDIVTILIKI